MRRRLSTSLSALCLSLAVSVQTSATDFKNLSVHDPSIVRTAEGMYYVIGSHMGGAKSPDLIHWTQVGESPTNQPYFKDIKTELAEALEWGKTETFWAGDYVQLADGKWYMYYCVCQGSCPQALIGYAVSDSPEGPFTDLGTLRRSNGYGGLYDPGDGSQIYFDIHNMPNCIDPHVFFDKENRLWMVYGSYSGGIFILELDPATGAILPKDKQPREVASGWPYGKRLTGGDCPLEAAYILYSPETDYYYLYMSMGGLGQQDGYNVRVARSTKPYGPYYDEKGQNMIRANGSEATMYKHGLKVMGNHRFLLAEGEQGYKGDYMSPGHNSAYYDPETGRYYLVFHTRFSTTGEMHQLRVHPMQMNAAGWLVVAPYRYAGEVAAVCTKEEVAGTYKYINLGTGVSKEVIESQIIQLGRDGSIKGAVSGTWSLDEGTKNRVTMTIGSRTYQGCFFYQYDEYTSTFKWTFSVAGGATNTQIWGSRVSLSNVDPACDLEEDADYLILNARSGHLLTASAEPEGAATQSAYEGGKAQCFRLHKNATNNAYQLLTAASGYTQAIGLYNNKTAVGTKVLTYAADDTLTSKKTLFNVEKTQRGTYSISKQSIRKMSVGLSGNYDSEGSAVVLLNYQESNEEQQWVFLKQAHKPFIDGIESIGQDPAEESLQIAVQERTLHAFSALPATFVLSDMSGRPLARSEGSEAHFEVPTSGVYLLTATLPDGQRMVRKVAL